MSKITNIQYTNSNGDTINIAKGAEYFLIGRMATSGLIATTFSTKAYNQHGRTYENTLLDELDLTLEFAIRVQGKTTAQIKAQRQNVMKVFNATLGEGVLKVTMDTGDIYSLDCHVATVPFFPTGLSNTNNVWQSVVVDLTASNPLWYTNEVSAVSTSAQTGYRYVRETISGSDGSSSNIMTEFSIYTGSGTDIATMTPTISNQNVTIGTVAMITDNDVTPDNYCRFGTGTQTVLFDLGSPRTDLNYIAVWHYRKDTRRFNFKHEVSVNGTTWVTLYDTATMGTVSESGSAHRSFIGVETSLNNAGLIKAPLRIEVNGASTNPTFINQRTGEFIRLNITTTVGQKIIINTKDGEKSVILVDNGVSSNIFNLLDAESTFFKLELGTNIITSSGTNNGVTTTTYKWNNLYTGI